MGAQCLCPAGVKGCIRGRPRLHRCWVRAARPPPTQAPVSIDPTLQEALRVTKGDALEMALPKVVCGHSSPFPCSLLRPLPWAAGDLPNIALGETSRMPEPQQVAGRS